MPDAGVPDRRVVLRGETTELDRAVDRLLVQCDVVGVHETVTERTVHLRDLAAPLPDLADLHVAVEDLVQSVPAIPPTGFEGDVAVDIGDELRVRPPWVRATPGYRGIELVVPRGMAFGSGEHESTQAALLALHRTWRPATTMVDVGAGSGILLAFGAVRGVERSYACDIESAAVVATRALVPGARVWRGGPEALRPGSVDLVVANMTFGELSRCATALVAIWNGRDRLVCSGLRGADEVDALRAEPAFAGLSVELTVTRGAFTALVFVRSAADHGASDR